MKSCWIVTASGKTALEFRDVAMPQAKPGEIVVRVRAAGLNRGEMIAGGVMHGGPTKLGGTEAAGEVHAVGEGVNFAKPGDRVMGRVIGRDRGAFAEYALMEAGEVMPAPAHLSWEQAAAIPVSESRNLDRKVLERVRLRYLRDSFVPSQPMPGDVARPQGSRSGCF